MANQTTGTWFTERWPKVSILVDRILKTDDLAAIEWHDMFSDIFHICRWDDSNGMESVRNAVEERLTEYANDIYELISVVQDDTYLLQNYTREWVKFHKFTEYLPLPFVYSNKYFWNNHSPNYPNRSFTEAFSESENPIFLLMLDLWDSHVYEKLKNRLLIAAMHLIQSERRGQLIDSSLIISLRDSIALLCGPNRAGKSSYVVELYEIYVEYLENYYCSVTQEYIESEGIRSYMVYATQKLVEEEERGLRYLVTSPEFETLVNLKNVCVTLFVNTYKPQIVGEIPDLLRIFDVNLLHLSYKLICYHEDGVAVIVPHFGEYINDIGLEEIRSDVGSMLKDPNKYVDRLLAIYNRFSDCARDAFDDDPLILMERDKVYQQLVNNTDIFATEIPTSVRGGKRRLESRCPELLASNCDMFLRKSAANRRLIREDMEKRADKVLLVLKFVNNRDIFMHVYKTHLMRRLLLETSADNDLEEKMVDRLRNIGMPVEQVNKLSRMFIDMKVSQDLSTEFRMQYESAVEKRVVESSNAVGVKAIDMAILTSNAWIQQPKQNLIISLPSELEDLISQIEEFYRSKHQGRNLIWQHHLSRGILTFTSNHGMFELEVTTYQIIILFAWNRRWEEKMSLDSLLTATGLQDVELRRILWSLSANPKLEQQIVLFEPSVKSEKHFTEATEFWINCDFSYSKADKTRAKRHLNLIGRLQLLQDITSEEETMAIVHLRQLRVQEAIMKIMKSRKTLHFNALYPELIELLQSQFIPSKGLIKEVIEWLIDGDYISRQDDMNIFEYIA